MVETSGDPGGQAKATDVRNTMENLKAKARGSGANAKNIVLCSDGTGNRGGKVRGTNVWALFNAVWRQPDAAGDLPLRTQVAFHDDGVGTQKFILFKLLGGALGLGYSRNIRELYKSLVLTYEPGDAIYLFGFSRGAYTVRCLAGLVLKCGILDRKEFSSSQELDKAVKVVFQAYRAGYGSIFGKLRKWFISDPLETYGRYLKEGRINDLNENGEIDTHIRFIGAWDTVDAVGVPFDELADALNAIVRFRFRDHDLHPNVDKACHAISLDDQRKSFWPVMWNEQDEKNGRIEQVWFAGVHSNVGGGYPKDQMAQVALDWMMEEAVAAGLSFYKDARNKVREAANAHGMHYDSRAGLAAYYRYQPRDLAKICHNRKLKVEIATPKVHAGVFRRIARATGDYAPANVPKTLEVVGTGTRDRDLLEAMESVLAATNDDRMAKLTRVTFLVRSRIWLYRAFLVYSSAIAGFALWLHFAPQAEAPLAGAPTEPPWPVGWVFAFIDGLLPGFLSGVFQPLLDYARLHWIQALGAVAVLLLLVLLKWWLETRSRHLSLDAWHELRKAVPAHEHLTRAAAAAAD